MLSAPLDWQTRCVGSGDGMTQLKMTIKRIFVAIFQLITDYVDIEVFMASWFPKEENNFCSPEVNTNAFSLFEFNIWKNDNFDKIFYTKLMNSSYV